MAEHGEDGEDRGVLADGFGQTSVSDASLNEQSLYDSLLRGVAAEGLPVHIDSEVGPQGKFILQQEIGSGAMGRVYRALDRYLLRDVAIKFILRPEGMNHDDFMALFWQEARIIARLDQHDNIVRILDVDRSSYPPFIVMEYLDGQSLEGMLRKDQLDFRTILHVMIGAVHGLREAHSKGVYHRDLKPSNIFIQNTGRVKLLDFGLARMRNHLFETSNAKAQFVSTHAVPPLASAGTPAYMAPEQWRGEDADPTTDLWAVGAILYRLLARIPAFEADTLAALSTRVMSGEPPRPIAALRPELPPPLCDLVQRLLRADRAQRPSSASEVIAVLEAVQRSAGSDAPHPAAAAPPRAALRPSDAWSTSSMTQEFAHGSGPDGPRYWEKMLLVLVPGADSGLGISPDHLSGWILHSAGVSFDVLHCPPAHGDIAESALRLRASLSERFSRPRHIFFITHGAGTSVALRMLLDEARRLRPRDGVRPELDVRSPFYRTRDVAILRPGHGVTSAHQPGTRADGDAAALVAEMVAEAEHFLAATLPTPALHYVGIDDDRPVASRDFSGLHSNSASVKNLASFLVRPEMMLARETIAQTFELDCAAKISALVAPTDSAHDGIYPTVPGAAGATQEEVFEDLLAVARARHRRPEVVVVAGDAGVGKSTVLRMVARRLCGEFITLLDGGVTLPVLIPLYFASLSSEQLSALDTETSGERRGRILHDILLSWWCDWLNDVTYADAIGIEWIRARLRSEPAVVIFDGIDEFITNHPSLGLSDFQQAITYITTEYHQNGWLTVLLGVRSSQPGLPLLAASNIREVLRLTTGQAISQFPAASAWLGSAADPSIRKLLFTPLILAHLHARRPPEIRPTTHGEVLLLALTTIIEQSDLCGKLDERGQPIDAQRWIDALQAVAWCLFRRLRGEIATSTLKFEAGDLYRSWELHLAATGQQAQGERLLAGFHLLSESRACDALLRRTILYPTGRGEVRFIHREWQDFLAARYLAQIVMFRHVDEFRHIGNTARISQMAGELLCQAGVCVDEQLVLALLQHARETGARLVTANFSALLTNSGVLIDGPAIDVFLSAVRTMPAIAQFITLIGLGYRALRNDDPSAQDLRHRLIRVFRDYLSGELDSDLEVMRSVAWCYLKAFAQRFGGAPVTGEPPKLGASAELAIVAMMRSTSDDGPRFLAEHRSVQMALLEVQQVVPQDPFRPISGIHYLYCLVVARRHGAGIAELGRELPALLAEGSPYAQAIERYQLVPELRELLAACRRLAASP